MQNLNTNIKAILSIIVVVFVFAYFFYCGITTVKPDPQVTIAAVTSLGIVLGYWFGSSSGSSAKDAVIAANSGADVPGIEPKASDNPTRVGR